MIFKQLLEIFIDSAPLFYLLYSAVLNTYKT